MTADLAIADTRFRACTEQGEINNSPGAEYRPFCVAGGAETAADISVLLVPGDLPDIGALSLLFSAADNWALFRDAENSCLVRRSPAHGEILLWVARLDRAVTSVTVHLGDLFLLRNANGSLGFLNPLMYPLDQLLLIMHLASRGGILVHAAGMVHEGLAYVFPGRCNAGKSTITRLFMEQGAHFLSDDRIVIRKGKDGFRAYGTPWPGEAGIAENENAPLAGIFFLTQSAVDRITPLRPSVSVARLLPVTSIPWYERDLADQALGTCDALLRQVPAFDFSFRIGPEAVSGFHEFVNKVLSVPALEASAELNR